MVCYFPPLTETPKNHVNANHLFSLFFSPNSPQKAPRPLLPETHDRLLPRRLLPRGPRRQRQSRHRGCVFGTPFQLFGASEPPLTASLLTPGVLTKEFLDFSASRGNNLRSIGLEPGCKWCLCTARWKEAMEAAKGQDDPVVPKWAPFLFFLYPFCRGILSVKCGLRFALT